MKIIRVEKDPSQFFRKQFADSRLARSGRPHHECDHAARNLAPMLCAA
jgi:hypothetical protein